MKNGSLSDDRLAPLEYRLIVAGPIAGTYQYNVIAVTVIPIGLKPLYNRIEGYNHYSLGIGNKSNHCFRFRLPKSKSVLLETIRQVWQALTISG